jgi:hypothetical protein
MATSPDRVSKQLQQFTRNALLQPFAHEFTFEWEDTKPILSQCLTYDNQISLN